MAVRFHHVRSYGALYFVQLRATACQVFAWYPSFAISSFPLLLRVFGIVPLFNGAPFHVSPLS